MAYCISIVITSAIFYINISTIFNILFRISSIEGRMLVVIFFPHKKQSKQNKRTIRQTDKQIHRQINRQTERERNNYTSTKKKIKKKQKMEFIEMKKETKNKRKKVKRINNQELAVSRLKIILFSSFHKISLVSINRCSRALSYEFSFPVDSRTRNQMGILPIHFAFAVHALNHRSIQHTSIRNSKWTFHTDATYFLPTFQKFHSYGN